MCVDFTFYTCKPYYFFFMFSFSVFSVCLSNTFLIYQLIYFCPVFLTIPSFQPNQKMLLARQANTPGKWVLQIIDHGLQQKSSIHTVHTPKVAIDPVDQGDVQLCLICQVTGGGYFIPVLLIHVLYIILKLSLH